MDHMLGIEQRLLNHRIKRKQGINSLMSPITHGLKGMQMSLRLILHQRKRRLEVILSQ